MDAGLSAVAHEASPPTLRGMRKRAERLFGLVIFLGGFALVIAVHPERLSGWALWAVSPLLLYFLYLLAFRGPPQRLRSLVAGSVVTGCALTYALAAGFGDESYKSIARLPRTGSIEVSTVPRSASSEDDRRREPGCMGHVQQCPLT
jgi:hypothetical protein